MTDMTESGNLDAVGSTGLVVREPLPWQDSLQLVETAEEMGYASVFVPEISSREAFSTLTGFSTVTSGVLLGTGVVTMQARSPATTAMAAATLQQLSGGRHVLGIGTGTSQPAPGRSTDRPLGRLRSYVDVVRQALSGRPVEGDEIFGSNGFVLGMQAPTPPIWLAALGDRAIGLVGEIADGVLLNCCTPDRVAWARKAIREVAEGAGRDADAITVGVYVRACLGVEEDVALPVLQEAVGSYASFPPYRRQFDAMGLGSQAREAARAVEAGRPEQVPVSLVRAIAVFGGRAETLARFDAYRQAGADIVFCYPVPARDPVSSIMGTTMAAAPATVLKD
jgi:alkanesulfonate monooxygenase SsuD/methylene tetrahydromethanopterin reductase-like flavin-dependent oxidoreductase (luciferase family)